jgi:hypothetical protein
VIDVCEQMLGEMTDLEQNLLRDVDWFFNKKENLKYSENHEIMFKYLMLARDKIISTHFLLEHILENIKMFILSKKKLNKYQVERVLFDQYSKFINQLDVGILGIKSAKRFFDTFSKLSSYKKLVNSKSKIQKGDILISFHIEKNPSSGLDILNMIKNIPASSIGVVKSESKSKISLLTYHPRTHVSVISLKKPIRQFNIILRPFADAQKLKILKNNIDIYSFVSEHPEKYVKNDLDKKFDRYSSLKMMLKTLYINFLTHGFNFKAMRHEILNYRRVKFVLRLFRTANIFLVPEGDNEEMISMLELFLSPELKPEKVITPKKV